MSYFYWLTPAQQAFDEIADDVYSACSAIFGTSALLGKKPTCIKLSSALKIEKTPEGHFKVIHTREDGTAVAIFDPQAGEAVPYEALPVSIRHWFDSLVHTAYILRNLKAEV